jgi:serine/threonine protein kinase
MNKQPMVTFAPGQRVGSYELLVEIAAGGTATVGIAIYRGAAGFERLVVVKRVHRQLTKDREFTSMLLEEARLASSIRHPNVVPVIDVVRADDEVVLVMDYVESVSLAQLVKQAGRTGKSLPPAVVSRILVDTLVGLHEAHDAVDIRRQPLRIVHRDVSPQNVIVGVDGVSRVIDFGIAKARTRVASTRAGVIKGKCAYMSPEQVDGKPLDRRSDVFAAGIVLWEALTGQRLFRGEDDFDELRRVMTAVIPPPTSLVAGLGPDVDAVLAHALARPLEERFQTTQAFARALEHAIVPASPRTVGEHVEALCGAELEMRHARLQAILGDELDRLSPRSPPLPATAGELPSASPGETLRMTPASGPRPGTLPMAGAPSVETLRSEEGAPASVETPLESDVPAPPRRSITPMLLLVMLASLVLGAGVAAVWLTRAGPSASPTPLASETVTASATATQAVSSPPTATASATSTATATATSTSTAGARPRPVRPPASSELKSNPYGH